MLKNRFGRFLLTLIIIALLFGGLFLLTLTMADTVVPNSNRISSNLLFEGLEVPHVILYQSLFLASCVCIVGQFCGDITNAKGLLNSGFVTFIKRLLFFVLSALAVSVGQTGLHWNMLEFERITLTERALCLFVMLAPTCAYWAYLFVYNVCTKKGWLSENKRSFPFILLGSYIVAFALSMLVAVLMTKRMEWLQTQEGIGYQSYSNWMDLMDTVATALYAIGIVLCIITKNWPFDELGDVNAHDMAYYNDLAIQTDNFAPLYHCEDCRFVTKRYDRDGNCHYYCTRDRREVEELETICFDFVKRR